MRGFELHLPPLRERAQDIPGLVEFFLGRSGKRIGERALAELMQHAWPGNVRQLRLALERARSAALDDVIDLHHLDLAARSRPSEPPPRASEPPPPIGQESFAPADASGVRLEEAERLTILRALELHRGNRSRASSALGIHRSTLRRRMRELGIER